MDASTHGRISYEVVPDDDAGAAGDGDDVSTQQLGVDLPEADVMDVQREAPDDAE